MHDLGEKQRRLSGAARPGKRGDIGVQIRLDHALRREARSVSSAGSIRSASSGGILGVGRERGFFGSLSRAVHRSPSRTNRAVDTRWLAVARSWHTSPGPGKAPSRMSHFFF